MGLEPAFSLCNTHIRKPGHEENRFFEVVSCGVKEHGILLESSAYHITKSTFRLGCARSV
jgi:hypothetical protein